MLTNFSIISSKVKNLLILISQALNNSLAKSTSFVSQIDDIPAFLRFLIQATVSEPLRKLRFVIPFIEVEKS